MTYTRECVNLLRLNSKPTRYRVNKHLRLGLYSLRKMVYQRCFVTYVYDIDFSWVNRCYTLVWQAPLDLVSDTKEK